MIWSFSGSLQWLQIFDECEDTNTWLSCRVINILHTSYNIENAGNTHARLAAKDKGMAPIGMLTGARDHVWSLDILAKNLQIWEPFYKPHQAEKSLPPSSDELISKFHSSLPLRISVPKEWDSSLSHRMTNRGNLVWYNMVLRMAQFNSTRLSQWQFRTTLRDTTSSSEGQGQFCLVKIIKQMLQ